MATITEDYVRFETAKLLKEKGFDEECHHVYVGVTLEWVNTLYGEDELSNEEIPSMDTDVITAPTLQMAMKWLRKIYHIHIRLINSIDESYRYEIYPMEGKYRSKCFTDSCYYETYEQACETAIKYCLENII